MMNKQKLPLPVLPTSAEIQATFEKVSQKIRLDNVFAGFSKGPTTSTLPYKSRSSLSRNVPSGVPKLNVKEIGIDLNHEYIKDDSTFTELNDWRKRNSDPGSKLRNASLKGNKVTLKPALFRLQKNAQAKIGKNFFGDVEKIAKELDSMTKSVRLSIKSELGENIGKKLGLAENTQKLKTITVASYNVEKKRAMDEATRKANEVIRNISRKLELKKKLSEERRRKATVSTFSSIAGAKPAKSILKPPKSKFLEQISQDFHDSLSAIVKNPREAIRTTRSFNRAQVLSKGTVTALAPIRIINTGSSKSVKFSSIKSKLNKQSDGTVSAKEKFDPVIRLELLKTRTNDSSFQRVPAFKEYLEKENEFNMKMKNKMKNTPTSFVLKGFLRDREQPLHRSGGLDLERKPEEMVIANLIQQRSLLQTYARKDEDKSALALAETYDRFQSANLTAKDTYKKILSGAWKADLNYDFSRRTHEHKPDDVVLEKFKEFNLYDADNSPRGNKSK